MKYLALILISSVLCVPTYGAPAKADAHTVNTPHSSSGDASASGANAAKASSESGTGGSKAGAGALDSLPHTDGPSMPRPDEVPRPDEIPSVPRPDELPTGPRPDVPRPDEKPYLPSKPPTDPMPSGGLRVDPIPHKGGKKPVTVQKVAASANMETGTAVASATNKRSTDLQNVKASGDKAIADAKIHNAGPGFKSQDVESLGNHLAVAKAEIVKRDTKIQDVKAKGNTAISKATNHQGGDKVVQSVKAEGGNVAIATADNSPSLPPNMSEPAPGAAVGFLAPASAAPPAPEDVGLLAAPASAAPPAPAPSEGRRTRRGDSTVQNLESSGRVAVSTVSAKTSETVSSVQNVATHGDALSVAHAEKS